MIKYGGQVRDWHRMPSEEWESMSDTNTKVVWRARPPAQILKSTVRLFKTRFDNPFPTRLVTTMDVISTKGLAAYDLVAATVAQHDPRRPVTEPAKQDRPEREFSRFTTVRVLDASGKPLAGALVEPGFTVYEVGVIGLPQYTSTNGEAVVRYPGMRTTSVSIKIGKPGYLEQYLGWGAPRFGNATWDKALEPLVLLRSFVPQTNTVTMYPS